MRGSGLRRLAQQFRSATAAAANSSSSRCSATAGSGASSGCSSSRRAAGNAACTAERQAQQTLRQGERSRLLRQRSNMLPTLVGRSGRQALLAFRAMNHTFALFGMMDDDGT